MPITATNKATRELVPAGNYVARCFQMIEIGTVQEIINGRSVIAKKVRIGWELPTELRVFDEAKGEQPLMVSKEYTLSMNEKSNLRKDLRAWRGKDFTADEAKGFDITRLIGAPCMLNVIHKQAVTDPSRVYEQIAGITPLPRGIQCPPAINSPFVLSYDDFAPELFDSLPDFIKDKMIMSSEYQAMKNPSAPKTIDADDGPDYDDPNSDLPF